MLCPPLPLSLNSVLSLSSLSSFTFVVPVFTLKIILAIRNAIDGDKTERPPTKKTSSPRSATDTHRSDGKSYRRFRGLSAFAISPSLSLSLFRPLSSSVSYILAVRAPFPRSAEPPAHPPSRRVWCQESIEQHVTAACNYKRTLSLSLSLSLSLPLSFSLSPKPGRRPYHSVTFCTLTTSSRHYRPLHHVGHRREHRWTPPRARPLTTIDHWRPFAGNVQAAK